MKSLEELFTVFKKKLLSVSPRNATSFNGNVF